jgi:hypothetical protein
MPSIETANTRIKSRFLAAHTKQLIDYQMTIRRSNNMKTNTTTLSLFAIAIAASVFAAPVQANPTHMGPGIGSVKSASSTQVNQAPVSDTSTRYYYVTRYTDSNGTVVVETPHLGPGIGSSKMPSIR